MPGDVGGCGVQLWNQARGRVDSAPMDWANLGKDCSNDPKNRRVAGRVALQHIECSLGSVQDLSSTGMKLMCKAKPPIEAGDVFSMVLIGLDSPVPVTCRAVWIRKSGWRAYQAGVTFMDMTPELRTAIAQLARSVCMNETILPDIERLRRSA